MHKALHPYLNQKITTAEHVREFGNDQLKISERARCPLCKQRMINRAISAPGSIGHFAHMPKSGFCPTKHTSGIPYLGLHPRAPDIENAKRIKLQFVELWQKHFVKLNDIVKGLHYEEFKKAILIADQERIWEYSNLSFYQLPYIFSTLMDYPSTNSFKFKNLPVRKCWFRCWFDSSVKQYEDLWIQRKEPLTLIRAWYKQPPKRKPQLDDLIDFHSIEVEPDFLASEKQPSSFVIERLDPWITNHFIKSNEMS